MRPDGREGDELRPVRIERGYLRHAEGSALIEMGGTKVICAATVEETVPRWMYGQKRGWITAEYGMLPRCSDRRIVREAGRGRSGRTYEIQRLIGRSFRAAVQLDMLPEITIVVDCDVIEADGGTRTASITGGCVALYDAIRQLGVTDHPMNFLVSAVSMGIVGGKSILDLDYKEDAGAQVDMNVVMAETGAYIEVQGTAEQFPFTPEQFSDMLELGRKGCRELIDVQKKALEIDQ
ncbi:MAG: ribonuclease PH [Candidatus Krumholzibacteriota bacterium]|nr:ribonuclease PH [Candidatus Krumholzibacteriota bacterium]